MCRGRDSRIVSVTALATATQRNRFSSRDQIQRILSKRALFARGMRGVCVGCAASWRASPICTRTNNARDHLPAPMPRQRALTPIFASTCSLTSDTSPHRLLTRVCAELQNNNAHAMSPTELSPICPSRKRCSQPAPLEAEPVKTAGSAKKMRVAGGGAAVKKKHVLGESSDACLLKYEGCHGFCVAGRCVSTRAVKCDALASFSCFPVSV